MAKALGHSRRPAGRLVEAGRPVESGDHRRPSTTSRRRSSTLASELLKAPRHLGIHSGGMVLTERPVGEVVPIEHARMENRTVLQWDKDDCAWMGLVKFDLLGLGMLAALQYCFDLVREQIGRDVEARTRSRRRRPGVYDMLCRADSIGVFQVGVARPDGDAAAAAAAAVLRPGDRDRADPARPDPGRRGASRTSAARPGEEPITYLHPKLRAGAGAHPRRPAVPGAADADGDGGRRAAPATTPTCCAGRWAPSAGVEKIESLKREAVRRDGAQRASPARWPTRSTRKIEAFANFGFAESPLASASRCSSTRARGCKLHYPAAFLAGAAARPADGVLLPAVAGRRRPPPRRRGAAARTCICPESTPGSRCWSTGRSCPGRPGRRSA